MATSRKTTTAAAKKPAAKKAAAPKAPSAVKDTFTKTSLAQHLAAQSGVEPKAVKAVMASLEATMVGALNKRGVGEFTLPGLLKIVTQKVPAKKKRFGKDPFTGEERWFPAKPASTRLKVRAMKRLKDAAQ
ncbi:MAG: HU family DNA-binding protein [Burkholderiaceae bacterium]